jgi:hypothetical protein
MPFFGKEMPFFGFRRRGFRITVSDVGRFGSAQRPTSAPALASILLVIQYFASGIYLIFVIFFAKQKQKSRQKIVLVRS